MIAIGELDTVMIDAFEGADLTPVMREAMADLQALHTEAFAGQYDPNSGAAWTPLSPLTVAAKGHSTILVESGRLRASLTGEVSGDSIRELVNEPSGRGFTFGTRVPYAGFHQHGDGVPERPMVGFDDEFVDQLVSNTADHLLATIAGEVDTILGAA